MMNFLKDRNGMNNNLFMNYGKTRTGMKDEYFEVSARTDGYLTELAQCPSVMVLSSSEFQSSLGERKVLWSFN